MAIGNSVNDEVREQHMLMKDKPLKEKIVYYAGYYWIEMIGVIAILIFVISMIHNFVTNKDEMLQVVFVNTFVKDSLDIEAYTEEVNAHLGLDPKKETSLIETNVWIDYDNLDQMTTANLQKIMVLYASGSLDAVIVNDSYLENNKHTEFVADLTELLPEDVLSKYEDRLVYLDLTGDDKDEVPVGVDVSDTSIMESDQLSAYYCFTNVSQHMDNAIAYLDYLLSSVAE